MNANDRNTKQATLNIATLAAFECYYGPIPKELVAHILWHLKGFDYTKRPEEVIAAARTAGLQWLAAKLEKEEERERFYNNTGIRPVVAGTPPGVLFDKKGTGQGEKNS